MYRGRPEHRDGLQDAGAVQIQLTEATLNSGRSKWHRGKDETG